MWIIPPRDPEGRAFITILIVFLILAVFTFGLRIYSRRLNKAPFDASDYFCSIGIVLDLGLVVLLWGSFSHGFGEDITQFTLADARFAAWTFIAIDIVWNAATVSIRISMLLFYIRIFAVRGFRHICWAIMGLNAMIFASVVLATCLICRPITYSFDKTSPNGECGDLVSYELYTAIMNLIADSIIVILPMPILWRLQMETKKKVGISIVLGLGAIICVLTLTRVLASQYSYLGNYTKQSALIALITGLEPIIGATNACLPFTPLVLKKIGQTQVLQSATANIRSVSRRINRGSLASEGFSKVDESGPTKGLRDIEMNPIKTTTYVESHISTRSQKSIPESGPWDHLDNFRRQDHILVRRDFSVE